MLMLEGREDPKMTGHSREAEEGRGSTGTRVLCSGHVQGQEMLMAPPRLPWDTSKLKQSQNPLSQSGEDRGTG